MTTQSPPQPHSSGARSQKDVFLGLCLGLIGVIIFSGTLPATRFAVGVFDPGFLTFGRAAVAGVAAAVTLIVIRKPFPKQHAKSLLVAGVCVVFAFPGFMALAMQTVPASHGGVVLGILPLATAIFATIIAGERPSMLFWICGIIGAILIVVFALRDGGWGFEIGDFWLLAAGLTASCGYVISGKLSRYLPGWEVICWVLTLFFPLALAGSLWTWEPAYLSAPPPQLWAFAYVSFGSMFLGFFAWNTGLNIGGIARVGQIQLLQTFFTLAIAAWLFGEVITLETMGFAVAVFAIIIVGKRAQIR